MCTQLVSSVSSVKRAVLAEAEYQGSINVTDLKRLVTLLDADALEKYPESNIENYSGKITSSVKFGFDEAENKVIKLTIDTVLPMTCQRCLEPVMIPVTRSIELRVADDDTHAQKILTEVEQESVIIDDDMLDLHQLVEDELILSLPSVPKHILLEVGKEMSGQGISGLPVCGETAAVDAEGNQLDDLSSETEAVNAYTRRSELGLDNPFDVLKGLKTN